MAAKRKRKTVQQLKHGYEGRFEPVVMAIENPDWTKAKDGVGGVPRFEERAVNRKHDVLLFLYSQGKIDQAQKQAGDRFLSLWEKMGGASARATDYLNEPVDGGAAWPDVDVAAMEAANDLMELSLKLGQADYGLLQNAICHNVNIIQIASRMRADGRCTDFNRKYVGKRFRDALDVAAKHWGYVR